jgi:hypothetical protein
MRGRYVYPTNNRSDAERARIRMTTYSTAIVHASPHPVRKIHEWGSCATLLASVDPMPALSKSLFDPGDNAIYARNILCYAHRKIDATAKFCGLNQSSISMQIA